MEFANCPLPSPSVQILKSDSLVWACEAMYGKTEREYRASSRESAFA